MTNIVENRKAFHDYFIEEQYEAGLVLEGWEVKAIREGRAQIKEAYVIVRDGALHLFGAHISPMINMAGFTVAVPNRTRKLLLNKKEIEKLIGKVTRSGYTIAPLNLHFTNGRVKCQIGLAKGKKQHDKRNADKDRDAKREIDKAMKQNAR